MAKISPATLRLAEELHSAAIRLLRLVRPEDRATDVGPAQLSALSVLVVGGSMSLKRLAAIEQVRPPTMVRIVRGLVEKQLAVSCADPSDARKISISATRQGRSLMRRARDRRVQALARMLTLRAQSELRQLRAAVPTLKSLTSAGPEKKVRRPQPRLPRRRGPARRNRR